MVGADYTYQPDTRALGERLSVHGLSVVTPHNPTGPLLDADPRGLKMYIHTKSCAQMFIAAIVDNNQKA